MSQKQFEKAVEMIQSLPKNGPIDPSQENKLFFYGRYKIVTIGKVNTDRPGLLDFSGKAKWDEWKAIENKSKEEAMKEYVDKLIEILKAAEGQEQLIKELEEA